MATLGRYNLWAALRATTFRSLRHPNYRRYFCGQIISFAGSWMQSAALMWLIYDRTGDPRWPSYILVAQVGPTVLLGPWGGGLADRWPKRRLVMATQTAFLAHAAILALLTALDWAWPPIVLALMLFSGVIQAVDLPARLAFVPELVPREDLINAIGLNALLFNSARAIGPALAAAVFVATEYLAAAAGLPPGWDPLTTGAVVCFVLNAASFVAVLYALWAITVPERADTAAAGDNRRLGDGLRYLTARPRLGLLIVLTLVLCIFGWPVLTLLPAYTRLHLQRAEQTYSLLLAALGAGALGGALTTATFGNAARRRRFLRGGATLTALGIGLLPLLDSPGTAAACAAAAGFGLILYLSTGQATLQLAAPPAIRGRLMAVWAMSLSASAPVGHLLAGQAAAAMGIVPVLAIMATGCAAVAACWILSPPVADGDGPPLTAPPSEQFR